MQHFGTRSYSKVNPAFMPIFNINLQVGGMYTAATTQMQHQLSTSSSDVPESISSRTSQCQTPTCDLLTSASSTQTPTTSRASLKNKSFPRSNSILRSASFKTQSTHGTPKYTTPKLNAAPVNEILPNLWLGECITDAILYKEQFTHIVSSIEYEINLGTMLPKENHLWIQIRDAGDEPIINYFDSCSDFIHNALFNGGKVLVHCYRGISRSTSFIMAYILKYIHQPQTLQPHTYDTALTIVIAQRSNACPNLSFQIQLFQYEMYLRHQQFTRIFNTLTNITTLTLITTFNTMYSNGDYLYDIDAMRDVASQIDTTIPNNNIAPNNNNTTTTTTTNNHITI